ncbi:ABC transporter permease [Streptomyces sp. NBC_01477]|uniref:ABC transporter permease n=1 Tax=Streptomyces sp. NBC_01477 TaxID=2976015 RepID=UPI002E318A1B|nr:ABC transporter permease [Streptomyces sp. NBC_01477]
MGTLVFAHAAYHGKEVRSEARTPVRQSQEAGAGRSTVWLVGSDSLKDRRSFSVVYLQPHTANAPLPPGVDHWPRPGEAVLSPGLLEAGAHEGIADRYGKLAGTIGRQGLEDPGEWLAYIRPAADMKVERPIELVTGFGPTAGEPTEGLQPGSARDDDQPEWMFEALLIGLLLLPSLVLLFAGIRAGAHGRDRRSALTDALGAMRRDRALLAIGETARPTLLGAIASVPVIAAIMLNDVRIPYVGYTLASADLRQYARAALLAPPAALAIALGSAVVADQLSGRARGNRSRAMSRGLWQRRVAMLCPPAILLAARGPELAGENTQHRVWITWIGLALVVLTLPAAVAAAVAGLGRFLERKGRDRGWAGALIGGRRISSYPAATARLVTGVIVALIVFTQAIAWQGLFGTYNSQLERILGDADRSVSEIGPKGAVSEHDIGAFLQRLPAGDAPIVLTAPPDRNDGPITVQGGCPALESLHLPCPDTAVRVDRVLDRRMQQLISWDTTGGTYLKVERAGQAELARQSALTSQASTLVVIGTGGHSPSAPALKELSYRTFPRGAQVRFPGEEWLTTSIPDRDQGRWVRLCGVVGIGVLVLAIGVSAMAEFLRHGRALAPLTVLTGGNRVFSSSAAWAVTAPLAIAGLVGAAVGSWLARPVSRPGSTAFMPADVMASTLAVVLALSAALGLWAAGIAWKQARDWQA